MKIIARDRNTGEMIELDAEEDTSMGILNYFYRDREGNYLCSAKHPYDKMPRHSVMPNMRLALGQRFILIIEIIE
ncbi:hypothetical protein E0H80_07815 [Acinetobacter sp. ANC 4779]|uniref:hypothetical protein n=1 Tax=Acinetobacter Taxon 24C TaxID=2839060 RepID=UPI0007D7D5D7|nr:MULTISPECIES: hypothetical protein [Acinetobacter Taxon 24C]OAL79186.1 hypothetical protein AY606_07105 [Acinetobacter sp. SFB]TCB50724.1 hypothetical protein E0H80_07815 [Acinetobacter sp. ANC 4779]